mgnify:CR=1 FL=1
MDHSVTNWTNNDLIAAFHNLSSHSKHHQEWVSSEIDRRISLHMFSVLALISQGD